MPREQHPAEPVVGDNGKSEGGFAEIARQLNDLYPNRPRPISRQLVHKWWMFRHYNAFPEAVKTKGSTNGQGRPVFDVENVIDWYASYLRHRGAPLYEKKDTVVHTAQPQQPGEDGAIAA